MDDKNPGSVDRAIAAIPEIIARLRSIKNLSPAGNALRNANIDTLQVLLDLVKNAGSNVH